MTREEISIAQSTPRYRFDVKSPSQPARPSRLPHRTYRRKQTDS